MDGAQFLPSDNSPRLLDPKPHLGRFELYESFNTSSVLEELVKRYLIKANLYKKSITYKIEQLPFFHRKTSTFNVLEHFHKEI